MGDQDPTQTTVLDESPNGDGGPTRVFTWTFVVVLATWAFLATILSTVMWFIVGEQVRETVTISLLSGLIALVSLVPGIVGEWVPIDASTESAESGHDKKGRHDYISPLFGGIILRLVATVALFVLCRYQMAAPEQWIAVMVLGWYSVLMVVEVVLLAKLLRRSDRFGSERLAVAIPLFTLSVPNTLTAH